MRRILLALVAVLSGLLLAATAAIALGGASPWWEPYPPVHYKVYKGKQHIQTTTEESYKWNFYDPETDSWENSDEVLNNPRWPAADKAKASRILYFRIVKKRAPTHVVLKRLMLLCLSRR